MAIHIIKLVVGIDSLDAFAELQKREVMDYHGTPAVPCWTRYAPKRADEILSSSGSIYRVIKNRIVCRHRILGFEMVERDGKKQCMIMQDARMIQTLSKPRRPFQGWRYLEPEKAPADRGVYSAGDEEIPSDIEDGLRDAGLL